MEAALFVLCVIALSGPILGFMAGRQHEREAWEDAAEADGEIEIPETETIYQVRRLESE